MKKILLLVMVLIATGFHCFAQPHVQKIIETDNGVMHLSKTADGKDMIVLSITCWDEMVKGTKYISGYLPASGNRSLCVEIANKREGLCRKGIGFSCSIYDCPVGISLIREKVNDQNRMCSVTLKRAKNGFVKIIFNDEVDWQSLQNTRPVVSNQ